jgi:hypothetical protein
MSKELIAIIEDFSNKLDDDVERILEIDEHSASCIGVILGAYVCKMVVDRYGKTEKAQEILNQAMQKSWEAINVHDKV